MEAEELLKIAGEKVDVVLSTFEGEPREIAIAMFLAGFGVGSAFVTSTIGGELSMLKIKMMAKHQNT